MSRKQEKTLDKDSRRQQTHEVGSALQRELVGGELDTTAELVGSHQTVGSAHARETQLWWLSMEAGESRQHAAAAQT